MSAVPAQKRIVAFPKVESLSPVQRRLIQSLARGMTQDDACAECRVTVRTLQRWRKDSPLFMAELRQARTEYLATLCETAKDDFRTLLPEAVLAARSILQKGGGPAARLAVAIFQGAGVLDRKDDSSVHVKKVIRFGTLQANGPDRMDTLLEKEQS